MAFASLLLNGCGEDSYKNTEFDIETITYVFDNRTNLCYAIKDWNPKSAGLGFVNIPCTEDVLKFIQKQDNNT